MTETRGAYLMNLGQVGYHEAWELQRSLAAAVGAGRDPGHGPAARASADDHARPADRGGRGAHPVRRLGRARRVGSRRQVDLPRARASSSATRSSTSTGTGATSSSTAGTSRRRSSARSRRSGSRRLGSMASPASGSTPAAEDRLDRRPHLTLGHDARVCAQRRSRPGAVHRVDHGLRARRRGVHDARARDRARRSPSTTSGNRPPMRSPRCSASTLDELPGHEAGAVAAAAPRRSSPPARRHLD